jgi:hypothetical protein
MNACLLAIATLIGAPATPVSPELAFDQWRSAPLQFREWRKGHLELTAAQLTSRSGVPIHLFDDRALGNPQIDLPALDENSTLGDAFELIARQLPNIKAVGTLNGVFWIHVEDSVARELFDRRLESPEFSGTVDGFFMKCITDRVATFGSELRGPFAGDRNDKKVNFKRSGKVKVLDAIIAVVDAHDVVLVLRISYGDKVTIVNGRRSELPKINYRLIDANELKLRRAEVVRASRRA